MKSIAEVTLPKITRPETTDLRKITRGADRCLSSLTITWDWQTRIEWLVLGQTQLRYSEGSQKYVLSAYLTEGATDFEHDSAYAFSLPLIGFTFDNSIEYSRVRGNAWVDPGDDEGLFRVPRPGYNPMKHPDTTMCNSKNCNWRDGPHPIIPEGFYAGPPHDRDLYNLVRGKRVTLSIGPLFREESS